MTKKNKRQVSPRKKDKGDLETENTIHPQMYQTVIVTKIHYQRTQILTMAQHEKLQRKICPWMIIPHQASRTSHRQKK